MATKIKISLLNEQIILGCMLRDPDTRKKLTKKLQASDFIAYKHKAIFSAIAELHEKKLEYIPITLSSFLPNTEDWGGVEYLLKLEKMSSPNNLEFHIEKAKWDLNRSQILQNEIGELEASLKDPRVDPYECMQIIHNIEHKLQRCKDRSAYIQGQGAIARYKAKLYAREAGQYIRTSGFRILDQKLTTPFGPGLVSVITAAPSIGKTTFALNLARRQAQNWKVGYLAWESGSTAAMDIICASTLNIPLAQIIREPETIDPEKRKRIDELVEHCLGDDGNLGFLDKPPKDLKLDCKGPWEINDRVLDWFDEKLEGWDKDIIYWDLFEKQMASRKPDVISVNLDRVQEIAQEHNVHICLLHQITFKEVEKKFDKRPTRSTLKGTGGYVEVSDFILGLYREAIYNSEVEDNILEVDCLKQRNGPFPFRILFHWNGECTKVFGGKEVKMVMVDEENLV